MTDNATSPNPSYVQRQNSVTAEWSRKRLELAPGDRASTHQQVCDYLKSCHFRPAGLNRTAVVGSIHPDRALRSTLFRELMTREMLSQFSSEFFELPADLRKEQMDQFLDSVVEFPQIRWRLNRLKQGVSISSPVPRGTDVDSVLASTMAEMFVMSPESAARVGRDQTLNIGGQKSVARQKERALAIAAITYPGFTQLDSPDGSSLVERLDRMVVRAKHLRPVRDYWKICALVTVIGAAVLNIASSPQDGGLGRRSVSEQPNHQIPAYQIKPDRDQEIIDGIQAMLKMQEVEERAKDRRVEKNNENEKQASDTPGWQKAYEQIQFPSSDLEKYVDDQKDRTDQLWKGTPSKSPGYVPGSALPGFQNPNAPDPAKDVDQFLDGLKNGQRTP